MAKYEVHIPASEAGGFNMTLKVGADNWMAALKAGMQKLGEQGAVSQNVMVDIQEDNSIHVTEPMTGRVFRIRELSEEEAAQAPVKPRTSSKSGLHPAPTRLEAKTEIGLPAVTSPPPPAAPDMAKTLVPGQVPPAVARPPTATVLAPTQPVDTGRTMPSMPVVQAPPPAAAPRTAAHGSSPSHRPGTKSSPRVVVPPPEVEELEHPVKPVTGPIGRPKTQANLAPNIRAMTEDLLADVFMRIAELDGKSSIEDAMAFILDLAMEKVPCEAGSILRADGATGDLTFITARGPKAKELLASHIVIPAASGIAGFCSYEGVSVAVSDVQKDPRFYAGVGEKVDYSTRSLLCSPMMTHGRSFGCVQVINRKGGPQFSEPEVGVLSYLSHQAALYLNNRI